MKKKFSITWDEYHECSATVEAESQEEAEEKWSNMEYLDFDDDVQNIDNFEICEEDDEETAAAELKPDNGQYDHECTLVENDKSNDALSSSGEGGMTSPHSLSYSQELKGGEEQNDN